MRCRFETGVIVKFCRFSETENRYFRIYITPWHDKFGLVCLKKQQRTCSLDEINQAASRNPWGGVERTVFLPRGVV